MEFSYRRVHRPILNLLLSIGGTRHRGTAAVAIPTAFRCKTCSTGSSNHRKDHLIES
jgi:hypothetical protein